MTPDAPASGHRALQNATLVQACTSHRSRLAVTAPVALCRVLACLLLAALLGACASRAAQGGDASAAGGQDGVASYYSDRHHGGKTASGERYDRNAMTAAHRSLPFGTRVRVRDLESGREVTVRINDRGPFVKGRIIDLSRAAAEQLHLIERGVAKVRVTPLD